LESIRRVLLPLDGSTQALDVLEPILALARSIDARVRILEVADPEPLPGRWESPDDTAKRAEGILRDACIPTEFERRRGNAPEEILKAVKDYGIDLVAMTTHGRSGPPRWLLGSVTAEVLRNSLVPLLVVRHNTARNVKNPLSPADISAPVDSPG
jgi:nucleotide-binding universal stress UspA family protein